MILVVGAGIVGVAVARRLALGGADVVIAEAERAPGTGITSRSSEVIHAGLYYASGSLKARLCVAGRHALYEYCAARGVPHRRCGKLVVATAAPEAARLEALLAQARANGVDDARLITAAEARRLEPELVCTAALLSPSSGIVDSHQLVRALLADARAAGAGLVLRAPVVGGRLDRGSPVILLGGADPSELRCDLIVNCAGLGAQTVAGAIDGFPADRVPRLHFAKGSYFGLRGPPPFRHLVYPIPDESSLGIHATLDLEGNTRFGPDAEWVDEIGYTVNPDRASAFHAAIRRYLPAVRLADLVPAYSGIRPKLHGPGDGPVDFVIQAPADHGAPGIINLFGIESPGLTAALAIADHVADLIA